MLKKMLLIFGRDLKISIRDFMSLFMLIIPLVTAICVNIFAPGIEDTTVNIALIKDENPAMAEYLADYANIRFYKDLPAVEDRVMQRDQVVAIVGTDESTYILTQGNESAEVIEFARLLKPGGGLIISHSESLVGIDCELRMVRPSLYVKPMGGAEPS